MEYLESILECITWFVVGASITHLFLKTKEQNVRIKNLETIFRGKKFVEITLNQEDLKKTIKEAMKEEGNEVH